MPPRFDPERVNALRREMQAILEGFDESLREGELRRRVRAVAPAYEKLRELGISLLPGGDEMSARDRILSYFLHYPRVVINKNELVVVSGISEWARRVRELRVEFGWSIVTGITVSQFQLFEDDEAAGEFPVMGPDDYMLTSTEQDREAALRWNVANSIRKSGGSARSRILEYLLANVGRPVHGEELRYVANNLTEWARRVRELRTEHGWQLATRTTGRPDLDVGVYVLQSAHQSPAHDRRIPDPVRRAVLSRDGFKCTKCGWEATQWRVEDPRHLELHHCKHHSAGGSNEIDNLVTLCVVCHDEVHRSGDDSSVCPGEGQ
jgi:hypothetical protein